MPAMPPDARKCLACRRAPAAIAGKRNSRLDAGRHAIEARFLRRDATTGRWRANMAVTPRPATRRVSRRAPSQVSGKTLGSILLGICGRWQGRIDARRMPPMRCGVYGKAATSATINRHEADFLDTTTARHHDEASSHHRDYPRFF